jgi:hypothetical protein
MKKHYHRAIPVDQLDQPLSDSHIPMSHPLLVREVIYYNAGGAVVKVSKVMKKSETDPAEVVYSQSFIPRDLDTAASGNPLTIFPWVQE